MALPAKRETWLTRPRVVGTPLHWARHAAGLAAGAAATGSTFVLGIQLYHYLWFGFGMPALMVLLMAGLLATLVGVSGALGGLVGLVHPLVLDRVRGRVPLPLIAASSIGVGAATAVTATGAVFAPLMYLADAGIPWEPLLASAAIGALATALWWLPFTLATVTDRRWPVTRVAGPLASALVFAAILALGL